MSSRWMAYSTRDARTQMVSVIRGLDAQASVEFAGDASELRRVLSEQGHELTGVAVGLTKEGVSDINLAAALVADGCKAAVVLVRKNASGSLLSRAARAGIERVVDPADFMAKPATGMTDSQGAWGHKLGPDPASIGQSEGAASLAAPSPRPPARHLPEEKAPVMVLCSGRGGVGKSALAAGMAALAASWGMRVGVVDLDYALGNVLSAFGAGKVPDMAALAAQEALDEQAIRDAAVSLDQGALAWGPCAYPEMAELLQPHASRIINVAARECDIVIVDCASTPTDAFAQAAQVADRLFIVSDGAPNSLAALSRMGLLAVKLGVARTRIVRIENRADPRTRQDFSFARAERGLESARAFRVFEGGRDVSELMSAGQVVELMEAEGPFSSSLASCLAQELKELGVLPDAEAAQAAAQPQQEKRGFWPFSRKKEAVGA